jgi:hypothetical protein
MQGENQSGMQCVDCEALLSEVLDGTLQAAALSSFQAHQQSCSVCRSMVEEASAGMHWLKALDVVEPPASLVHNILVHTIGTLPAEHAVTAPHEGTGWLERLKGRLASVFAPVATPRFAMSFGMAFFSITMLLSIAGFHAADLRHLDLSSKSITKAYYSTEAHVVRYYENIRLVYEIESRVRDLRRVATPQKQEDNTPKNPSKSDSQPDQERRNQNYRRDDSQTFLAACPVTTPQARLNRRTA